MSAAPAPPRPSAAADRRSWHRRAARPVSGWLVALLIVVVLHPWIPQSRWLLVHMVTLGLVTTSIMVWGQHFTEALLRTRLAEESRPRQVLRIRLLTTGVLVTIAGMLPSWPWLVVAGSLLVSGAMLWYAAALGAQVRAALPARFGVTVNGYIAAACLLPAGALLGAVMAFSPGEPWQGRLLLAHELVNVLGFVGLTVTATLLTLWPTVLRTRIPERAVPRARLALVGMPVGAVGAAAGALLGAPPMGCAFLLLHLGSFLAVAATLVQAARQSRRQHHRSLVPLFPVLSIAAGVVWFVLAQIALLGMWWASADEQLVSTLVAADVQRLTVPLVAGFLLQVLLGAMSHLLPVTMGGGPRATTAGLALMSRGAVPRVVAYNLALAVLVLADLPGESAGALLSALTLGTLDPADAGSLTRVLVSLVAFAALLGFVVTMMLAVRSSVRLRRAASSEAPTGAADGAAPEGPTIASPTGGTTADGPAPDVASPAVASPAAASPAPAAGSMDRRALTGVLVGAGSVLAAGAFGASLDRSRGSVPAAGTGGAGGWSVAPTGRTTTLDLSMVDMRFVPDVLEVPAGDVVVITLRNDDPYDVHDLVLADGTASGRLQPGETVTVETGVITHDLEGWCSIVGHRAMGMVMRVRAVGADGAAGAEEPAQTAHSSGVDELTRVPLDLQAAPGPQHPVRDATLPEAAGPEQRVRLEITETAAEIAPGVTMDAMTFGGTVVGPVLRSELGARLTVDLVNSGSMGHSLDLHAGRVSPDAVMRTIPPGESLEYSITTDHAGVWLYHCSTMPMTVHLAAGMVGALIVPPAGLAAADREYVLVQSDHYLVPAGAPGYDEAMHEGAHPVSPAKISAERPDATVFNGHANQYVHSPLTARVGERVRLWVLAAGPSRGISFHVVGGVFDTVFKEGEYLLRPENENGGGSQALDLAAAQGGFVELVFEEPGTYTAVNHSFADMERGARALITVTA
ncbi:multicopper oxidase domain-containing protein [Brachybacterium aquaticum]|uniref:Nitrite reductase (NO-forming) n=1 Tax=Brachybacterium aquaticum TaxID=1432564 RepID=A0A841AFY0_9MICO|nr:multicopper oxidase domain-containing protein [Brachybacterium aquaticum]MBB5832180.1 nitrite reductase (NO-forming) [Brachybacterium aquaticum]